LWSRTGMWFQVVLLKIHEIHAPLCMFYKFWFFFSAEMLLTIWSVSLCYIFISLVVVGRDTSEDRVGTMMSGALPACIPFLCDAAGELLQDLL
jgi:hypothetical protein